MVTTINRLRPNEAEVAAKVMDGEAVIINLASGTYFSMDKAGGLVWELIEGRHTLEEVVAAVVARYEVSSTQAQTDIERLLGELTAENLVMVADGEGPRLGSQPKEAQQRQPYEAPRLNAYRDMADLLALDPPMPGLYDTPWAGTADERSGEP